MRVRGFVGDIEASPKWGKEAEGQGRGVLREGGGGAEGAGKGESYFSDRLCRCILLVCPLLLVIGIFFSRHVLSLVTRIKSQRA